MDTTVQAWSRLADEQFSEQAKIIGIITAQGAMLEAEIEMLFSILIGARYNQAKIIYYAMMSLPPRLNIIQSLIFDNYSDNKELKKSWKVLRTSIESATGERNRCVHAIWAENPQTHALQRRNTHSNGKYERKRIDMSTEDLMKIGTDLAVVAGQVNQFSVYLQSKPLSQSPNI